MKRNNGWKQAATKSGWNDDSMWCGISLAASVTASTRTPGGTIDKPLSLVNFYIGPNGWRSIDKSTIQSKWLINPTPSEPNTTTNNSTEINILTLDDTLHDNDRSHHSMPHKEIYSSSMYSQQDSILSEYGIDEEEDFFDCKEQGPASLPISPHMRLQSSRTSITCKCICIFVICIYPYIDIYV